MFPGGRVQANATLRDLIARAYALQPYQRIKGTARVLDEWFVIVANAPGGVDVAREAQLRRVRRLLADRFKLSVRFEDEWQPVSILRRATSESLGPHLRPLKESCAVAQAPPSDSATSRPQQPPCHVTFINGHMTALVERMADFSRAVSFMSRRAVVDETGLDGSFELEMTFNTAIRCLRHLRWLSPHRVVLARHVILTRLLLPLRLRCHRAATILWNYSAEEGNFGVGVCSGDELDVEPSDFERLSTRRNCRTDCRIASLIRTFSDHDRAALDLCHAACRCSNR
jgi:uncharacterized protein (TIGR03435 family)